MNPKRTRQYPVSILIILTAFTGLSTASANQAVLDKIQVPEGFHIDYFSDSVPNARSMALGNDGTVYVGTRTEGKVYALPDLNNDGKADKVVTIASGLTMPNGVEVISGDLYVAEVSRLIRFSKIASQLENPPDAEVIFDWLPTKIHHGWKYLRQGPDGKLYLPVGAPCNVCRSAKEIFATIVRINTDGSDYAIYARGVRNSVGFDWHPITKHLYFNDNGRDMMGDDIPPDELNHAAKPGLHFGYPFCHGNKVLDPQFGGDDSCTNYQIPAWNYPAHVTPLGMRFYTGNQFPENYKNQLFVAQHGSWNRKKPRGYRVILVKFKNNLPASSSVFADGWLDPSGRTLGRPVDVLQLKDGSLLISDDKRGAIYRIHYETNNIADTNSKK